jgi:hypothetical protein
MFLDHSEMTPGVLDKFSSKMGETLFTELYFEGGIDDTEKTLRCMMYEWSGPYFKPPRIACEELLKPFKDGGRGEFLNVLARSGREDRALHSTMVCANFLGLREPGIDKSLIKYSVLSLSDLKNLDEPMREAAELAGMTLPPVLDVSKLPFKERFGRWLRGRRFVCSDDPPVSFKDVLGIIRLRPISINRMLSEPLFVVGDRALTEEAAGQKGVKLTRVVDALIFASDQIGKGSNFKEEYRLEDSRVEELELAGLFAAFSEGRRITIAPEKWDGTINQFSWALSPINVEELTTAMRKQKITEE